jgi:hypothetical protein
MEASFRIKPLRQSFSVRFMFARPILSWEGVGKRFMTALYDSISPKIPIQPNEILMNNGPALSDIWIKYSIYGGASSITLSADRVTLDFPSITSADLPIALDILRTGHDTLPKTLHEQGCDRIEAQTVEHLDLITPGDIDRFLERFRLPVLDAAFKEAAATQLPSVKFGLVSDRENWQYTLMAERSLLSATAIFVLRSLVLRPVDLTSPFEKKFELAQSVVLRSYAALGLELEIDAASA